MAVHAGLRVRQIRMRRDFDKAVAITAIHPELGHVDVVRKRHRLDRLIADAGIFWRDVIPRGRGQSAGDQDASNRHLQRQPVAPAWKEIRHKISGRPASPDTAATLETNSTHSQDVRTSKTSLYESKFARQKKTRRNNVDQNSRRLFPCGKSR